MVKVDLQFSHHAAISGQVEGAACDSDTSEVDAADSEAPSAGEGSVDPSVGEGSVECDHGSEQTTAMCAVTITTTTVISGPLEKRTMIARSYPIGGSTFIDLHRSDKETQRWLTGFKAWSAKVSLLIACLVDYQTSSSAISLGAHNWHNLPTNRRKREMIALKKLAACSSKDALVVVTLPSFVCFGAVVEAVETRMPLRLNSPHAAVELKAGVLNWIALKCETMDTPATRKAQRPPLHGKYWHKQKQAYYPDSRSRTPRKKESCASGSDLNPPGSPHTPPYGPSLPARVPPKSLAESSNS